MEITRYASSDEFIARMESLSGMLTRIRTEYGGAAELVEHPDWDDNRTVHATRLTQALLHHLRSFEEEMTNHVNQKFG